MVKSEWKKYFKIAFTVFILFLLMYYWGNIEKAGRVLLYALVPLLAGFVMAYIVNMPLTWLERSFFGRVKNKFLLKIKRPVCLTVSFAMVAALIFLVVKLIVPEFISCIELLVEELPPIFEDMYKNIDDKYNISSMFEQSINEQFGGKIDWHNLVERAFAVLSKGFVGVMGSVFTFVSAVFSTVFNVFVSFIFAIYLLVGKEKLIGGINKIFSVYVKPSIKSGLDTVISVVDESFHKFLVGQCTEAVILGLLCMIGMTIFGFPYATMIGTLIGFTALIPIAGAYIGAGIGAFMVFTAGSLFETLLFVVFIIVLQQVEGNLIYPRVVGASIGLPGIWVLAAVTIGGATFGIPGMLIGVPLAASAYKLLKNDVAVRSSGIRNEQELQETEENGEQNAEKPAQESE